MSAPDKRDGEIANLAVHAWLVEVEALDDLEPQRFQSRCHISRVVARILQLRGALVGGVADDKRHTLGLGCLQNSNAGEKQNT